MLPQPSPQAKLGKMPIRVVDLAFDLCVLYTASTEGQLPQRKHTGIWDEDKAYLTLEKCMHNSRKVGYYFPGVK
jgi:hypothetical protein